MDIQHGGNIRGVRLEQNTIRESILHTAFPPLRWRTSRGARVFHLVVVAAHHHLQVLVILGIPLLVLLPLILPLHPHLPFVRRRKLRQRQLLEAGEGGSRRQTRRQLVIVNQRAHRLRVLVAHRLHDQAQALRITISCSTNLLRRHIDTVVHIAHGKHEAFVLFLPVQHQSLHQFSTTHIPHNLLHGVLVAFLQLRLSVLVRGQVAADEVDVRCADALHADGGKIERATNAHAALVTGASYHQVLSEGHVLGDDLVDGDQARLDQVDTDEHLQVSGEVEMHNHGDVPVEAYFLARTSHLLFEPRIVTSNHSVRTHFQFR